MKIWIDLDNTPHVPFFRPIVRELNKRGHSVVLTARAAFQVCELADLLGLSYVQIGRHYGKNPFLKAFGLLWRSAQMLSFYIAERPALALSHGSRSQILLCNVLRVPNIMIVDYEHASTPWPMQPGWEIVPAALVGQSGHCRDRGRIATYDGIKEDVYAHEFCPDSRIVDELGLSGAVIVTVRPPADEAHYHVVESETMFTHVMERLCTAPNVKVILVPRNHSQLERIRRHSPHWFANSNVVVPSRAVDGLNLLWHSDLVVSGGGTMNREAAALGIPVYSIFRGPSGAVDRQLQREGRLVLLESKEEIDRNLALLPRDRQARPACRDGSAVLMQIVDRIDAVALAAVRHA